MVEPLRYCIDIGSTNNVTPLLIMNKWDLLDTEQKDIINKNIKQNLKRFDWLNILRISALTKKGIKSF